MKGKHSASRGKRSGKRERKCVAKMQSGQTGTIEEIDEHVRARTSGMGVRPGKQVTVHTKQPFDGPVVVSVGESMTSLSRRYARGIEVSLD
ncbi:MAG: FeoA family protein [Halobacteriales archaeon]